MSTKGKDNGEGSARPLAEQGTNRVSTGRHLLRFAALDLAYFSGYARSMAHHRGGAGIVLRFERVRPPSRAVFQPLQSREISPDFLDRMISALKRWDYDLISMDDVCQRVVTMAAPRRFVALTFDGGYRDWLTFGYPVLARHAVPFTLYLSSALTDGIGEAWWLALEQIVARENRIYLEIDRKEMFFSAANPDEKQTLFDYLERWLRSLAPADLSHAARDLCRRYSVDLSSLTREAFLNWSELEVLAADPNVTIGSAGVNYSALSKLREADARREVKMGKAVTEAALGRSINHFAYPFGDGIAWDRRHMAMVEEAGFSSAVSTIPAVVEAEGGSSLYALPRLAWDGRMRSLRHLRVLSSGATFPRRSPIAPG